MPRIKSSLLQAAIIIGLSLLMGGIRSFFPGALSWNGRWPTSSTSTEEAYAMMALANDPPFVSLTDAIQLHEKKTAIFMDARSPEEFLAGHIPGARNLSFYDLDTQANAALDGLDPTRPVVIYCEGVGCELSLFLGRELRSRGYRDLRIFYGGYPEWKNAGLPTEKS